MISVVIISKDEAALDQTLTEVADQVNTLAESGEILVVDASSGRLDDIRDRHAATVRWLEFQPLPGIRVTIPHQRNTGVRAAEGDIIVFIDAGCQPAADWLPHLIAPLRKDDDAVAGVAQGCDGSAPYEGAPMADVGDVPYLRECATMNFAFRRAAFDAVGGFDESFAYGSDVDFSWRLNDSGYRIRSVPDAIVRHDYGSPRRQRRRSYAYGKARALLYRKHHNRIRHILANDPIAVVYPIFLVCLPITLVFPVYPLLLLIPMYRNRAQNGASVVVGHLFYGAGVLAGLAGR
jgi:glycosyltransferase involved in cell wall biosynthesis